MFLSSSVIMVATGGGEIRLQRRTGPVYYADCLDKAVLCDRWCLGCLRLYVLGTNLLFYIVI